MADVKIFGHQFKQWQVWAVVIGGTAVTYLVWRAHQNAAAAASTTAAGSQVDPVTGLTNAQDAAQYGSVQAADTAFQSGGGYDTSPYGYGTVSGAGYGTVGTTAAPLGVTSGTGYASNADWAQAVEAGLSTIGYSTADVAAAVGRYLGGLSLTPDQQNIINVALAEYGPPPSGSYSIIAAPATSTAASGNSTAVSPMAASGSITSAASSGSTASTASAVPTLSGGHVVRVSNNDAVVAWTSTGATSWRVTRTGPGGTQVNTVTIPQASYSGLSSGHNYEVTIQPLVNGQPKGPSGVITFKTT